MSLTSLSAAFSGMNRGSMFESMDGSFESSDWIGSMPQHWHSSGPAVSSPVAGGHSMPMSMSPSPTAAPTKAPSMSYSMFYGGGGDEGGHSYMQSTHALADTEIPTRMPSQVSPPFHSMDHSSRAFSFENAAHHSTSTRLSSYVSSFQIFPGSFARHDYSISEQFSHSSMHVSQTQSPTWSPTCEPTAAPFSQGESYSMFYRNGYSITHSAFASLPEIVATRQPTVQPTPRPTSGPSGQPSSQPSSHPSSKSSEQPSSQPSSHPSSKPSEQPSSQPTGSPSSQPSSHPSSKPSGKPSSQPSERPTGRPTCQPTVRPSSAPSGQPSTQPSGQPSSKPSAQPSSAPTSPTGIPSGQPSGQPSSEPTTPTGQPSGQPTGLPSSQPTGQPSGAPSEAPFTSIPSSQPTTIPTQRPFTSEPTTPGGTLRPTEIPTSAPSWDLYNYDSSVIYNDFVERSANYSATYPDIEVFSNFFYKGSNPVGGCDSWKSYTKNNLFMPFDFLYISGISLAYTRYDYGENNLISADAKCGNREAIEIIVDALTKGVAAEVYCDDEKFWRVFYCQGNLVFCVDCETDCEIEPVCPGSDPMFRDKSIHPVIINPCSTQCTSHRDAFSAIGFTVSADILYPQISEMTIVSERQALRVLTNVTRPGTIYCAALQSNIKSTIDVTSSGFTALALSSGMYEVLVTGLIADSDYTVYCYTENFKNHLMDFDVVKENAMNVSTQCCKTILLNSAIKSIAESSIDQHIFSLDSKPSLSSSTGISIASYPCDQNEIGKAPGAVAVPSTFKFGPTSLSNEGKFIIRGKPGCYNVSIDMTSGNSYVGSDFQVTIRSSLVNPDPPILLKSRFQNNPSQIKISFDSPTNRGKFDGLFNCSSLLHSFTGSDNSRCQWVTNKVMIILLGKGDDSGNNVETGDIISLKPNIIQPSLCPLISQECKFSISTSVAVDKPKIPLVPSAALSTSSIVGECADINIDPSQSTGAGGRKWKSLSWDITGDGTQNSTEINLIKSLLNSNYPDTRRQVVIPNKWLSSPSTYVISLKLKNFLDEMSLSTVAVSVLQVAKQPVVSIDGMRKVSKFRGSMINLYAIGSIPKCGSSTSTVVDVLQYRWKVYEGTKFLSSVVSVSSNDRYFKLNPFTLDSNAIYTVAVTATIGDASATNTVTIEVGSAGVVASILGGSTRSGSTSQTIVLESSSYDIDYPSDVNALTYTWRCSEVSPSYGADCPTTLDGSRTNVVEILAESFARSDDASYEIVLFVENLAGFTGSASTTISLVSASIPDIIFSFIQPKYNPTDKIIISSVVSTIGPAWVSWSSSEFNSSELTSKTLTSSQYLVPIGTTIAELAIKPNSLVAGATYSFLISSTYSMTYPEKVDKFEQIEILMNSPPTGGILAIEPAIGLAMNTSFLFQTYDWTDDIDDYPIVYVMLTYADSSSKTTIKTSGELTFSNAVLGQGLEELDYLVYADVEASDIYGAIATTSSSITVNPVVDTAALSAAMDNQLESAFANNDPVQVSQVINAVTSALNVVNCTTPVLCSTLNRNKCINTPKTCGECKEGYIGVDGDANYKCSDPNEIFKLGDQCPSDEKCSSNYCVQGICKEHDKKCKNDCSGHGTCRFVDTTDPTTIYPECGNSDSGCYAECQDCTNSYFGGDCSMSLSAFDVAKKMREDLCVSIYDTVAIQDISSDVVRSRSSTISSLLTDASQLTTEAIANCTWALINTISLAPEYVGQEGVSDLAAGTLSAVLALDLNANLLANVSKALSDLTSSIQGNLAVGEPQKDLNTKNARIGASVVDPNSLSSAYFVPPQSDSEKFNERPMTKLSLDDSSGSGAIGVSVVQYNNNPSGAATDSTPIGLQTTSYDTATSRRRRRRKLLGGVDFEIDASSLNSNSDAASSSRRLQTSGPEITVVLQNGKPADYFNIAETVANLTCSADTNSYNATVECLQYNTTVSAFYNESYSFHCPANVNRTYTYTCPSVVKLPECRMWDGEGFNVNPDCILVSYSLTNTTCKCETSSRRRLSLEAAAQSELNQFSSSSAIVGGSFRNTMNQLNRFAGDDDDDGAKKSPGEKFVKVVSGNTLIFTLVGTILAITIGGLVIVSRKDIAELRSWHKNSNEHSSARESKLAARDIEKFFNDCIPFEFSGRPWYQRFYKKLVQHHDWISVFLPYNPERDFAWTRFCFGMTKIINFLFVDTILAGLFFADDGTCETYPTEETCTFLRSLNQVDSLCQWKFDYEGYANATAYYNATSFNGTELAPLYGTCSFSVMSSEFVPTLLLVIVLTIFTIPLDQITQHWVTETQNLLFEADKISKEVREEMGGVDSNKFSHHYYALEMDAAQDLQSTILRAARLDKMRETIDNTIPEDEAQFLIHELSSTKVEMREKEAEHVSLCDIKGQVSRALRSWYMSKQTHHNSDDAAEMIIYEKNNGAEGVVLNSILKARDRAEEITETLDGLNDESDKDAYLLQSFILDSLDSIQRLVAESYMEESENNDDSVWYRRACLFMLICYILFCCLYIFLFGSVLGPAGVELWLKGTAFAFMQDIALLQPVKILLLYIVIASYTSDRVRVVHGILRERARGILRRKKGLMKDSNALIQHLSPACRAARAYPGLRMSRLLMSLNDHDIPVSYIHLDDSNKDNIFRRIRSFFALLFVIALIIVALLVPEIFGDSALEAAVTVIVNSFIGTGYVLSIIGTIALPFSIFVITVGAMYYHEVKKLRNFRNNWSIVKPVETVNYDELDEVIDLDVLFKNSADATWRSKVTKNLEKENSYMGKILKSPSLKMKNLPSMANLIDRGILPNIFSPSKSSENETELDRVISATNTEKIGSKSPVDNSNGSFVDNLDDSRRKNRSRKHGGGRSSPTLSSKNHSSASDLFSLFDETDLGNNDTSKREGNVSDNSGKESETDDERRNRRKYRRERRLAAGNKEYKHFETVDASVRKVDVNSMLTDDEDDISLSGTKHKTKNLPPLKFGSASSNTGGVDSVAPKLSFGTPMMSGRTLQALGNNPVKILAEETSGNLEDDDDIDGVIKIRKLRKGRAPSNAYSALKQQTQAAGGGKSNEKKIAEAYQDHHRQILDVFSSALDEDSESSAVDSLKYGTSKGGYDKEKNATRRHRSRKKVIKLNASNLIGGQDEKV